MDSTYRQDNQPNSAAAISPPSAEAYAAAVARHQKHSKDHFLFSGFNYRQLSSFLNRGRAESSLSSSSVDNWPFAILQTHGPSHSVEAHSNIAGLDTSLKEQSAFPTSCQILFLRGFASKDWLNAIGAALKVNPEFFRRHLDFLEYPLCYDLPALPSSSSNIITLKITTIGSRSEAVGYDDVLAARRTEVEDIRKYQQQLGKNDTIGESILRKISSHDETILTIEQRISCTVRNRKNGFIVIVWLDTGKSLEACPDGYWIRGQQSDATIKLAHKTNTFLPVVQHRRKGPLQSLNDKIDVQPKPSTESVGTPDTGQSARLLASNYGSTLDADLVSKSVMYALSELFSFAAHSESQFLNLISTQVMKEMREYDHVLGRSIWNLRYYRTILKEHTIHISEKLLFLREGGDPTWPKPDQASEIIDNTLAALQMDFEYLLRRAESIIGRCEEGSKIIMENSMLEESKKGRDQAAVIGRLSVLAFFFLPLSFVTSLFGMNFVEFGQGNQSIWLFAVVLVPFFVLSATAAFPEWLPWRASKVDTVLTPS